MGTGSSLLTPSEQASEERQLRHHEGYRDTVYRDSLGNPTFGIGHLIKPSDPEYGKPIGTKVSQKRVKDVFEADVKTASDDVYRVFPKADKLPSEVKGVAFNMTFNLGYEKMNGFNKFKTAVNKGDYNTAADEMVDSRWCGQVGNRCKDLEKRMRAAGKNQK